MADLPALVAGYRRKLQAVADVSAAEASARIVARTPVDTGKARRSWAPSGSTRIGETYRFSSAVDYMPVLEFGRANGRPGSMQAPRGMVRITAAEWQPIVDAAARGV